MVGQNASHFKGRKERREERMKGGGKERGEEERRQEMRKGGREGEEGRLAFLHAYFI
jgi:hypothetical protein